MSSTSRLALRARICLCAGLTLVRTIRSVRSRFLPRPPIGITRLWWYRNINLLSIVYAFQPRLRVRLTLGGFTVPRKPWVCGEQDSHLLYRYSFRHYHFQSVHVSSPSRFTHLERSPTPAQDQRSHTSHGFGYTLEPRSFSAQDFSTSELLRTL